MALYRSIATVGGWTMASRVLGFVRDILIAGVIGAGPVADAFFVAFKFPNFFRRLFAEGAFNAAFVPIFTRIATENGKEDARAFAGEAAAVLIAWLVGFTVAVLLAMPLLMHLIAPGFANDPPKFQLTVELTRLTFPYLLFMALVALLGGMLNAAQRFAATAAAPIVLNIVMIAALVGVQSGLLALPGQSLAWAVALAGIGQFLWIAYACRNAGLLFTLSWPRLTPNVKRLLRLMAPGLVGAGAVQVNLVIDVVLASTLAGGSVSFLYYADRVNQLPLGVIGVAVGVALLPLMTRQLRSGDPEGARDSQNRAIEISLLLTLPAAAALIAVPDAIIVVLFQRGAFGPEAAAATAAALRAFAVGLPAYVLIKALVPAFFAREDTKTPVKVAIVAVISNVALAIALMQVLAHAGIALATALSAWLNAGLLAWLLLRSGRLEFDRRLRTRAPKTLFSALAMAISVWVLARFLAPSLAGGEAERALALAAMVSGGLVVFGVLAQLTGAFAWHDMRTLMARQRREAPSSRDT